MAEVSGIIDHWNDQKGFGFISTAQGEKYFFHISVVRGAFRPQQGENVLFQTGSDSQGRMTAIHVRHSNIALDSAKIRIKPRINAAKKNSAASLKPARLGNNYGIQARRSPWVILFLLLILPLLGALSLVKDYGTLWLLFAYIVMSLITYYFYWDDKRRAKASGWRIPEVNLHVWSLAGGWPGAFMAQQQLRHKTKKFSFQLAFWLIVIAHQLLWFDWLILGGKWFLTVLG